MGLDQTLFKWNKNIIELWILNGLISTIKMRFLLAFLFLCLTFYISAQNQSFYQFNTDNGLPSNETYKIIEDSKGYIWIATDRGVIRYDGYEFDIFTTEDGLANNVVFWIYEDNKGRIWFSGIDNSLCYFENNTFIEHPASEKLKKLSIIMVLSMYVNEEDIVWLGALGNECIFKVFPNGNIVEQRFEGVGYLDVLVVKFDQKNVIFGVSIQKPKESHPKEVWVYDQDAVLQRTYQLVREENYELTSLILAGDTIYLAYGSNIHALIDSDSHSFVYPEKSCTNSLFRDDSGNLWMGMRNGGVGRFLNGDVQNLDQSFLESWSVSSVCQDREGGYWFSTTEAGVFYYPSHYIENLGLFNQKISEIRNIGKVVWAMTRNGMIYEITKVRDEYNFKQVYNNTKITVPTYVDFDSTFWVSIRDTLQWQANEDISKKARFGLLFNQMIRLQDSTIWITNRAAMLRLSWPDFAIVDSIAYPSELKRVMALKAISSDELLLGGISGLWTLKDNEIKRHKHHRKVFENRVIDLEILENNDIVIATLGAGVIRLDTLGEITQITKKSGILSSLINCSYTLPGDSITWVGSGSGLSQIKWMPSYPDSVEILNFTIFNGLNSNDILSIDYVEDNLWIGTSRGIIVMKPDDFRGLKKSPLIHLESMFVNGIEMEDTSTYFLSPDDFVKLNFGGISMNSKGNMNYCYRIKGFDDSWEYISNRILEFKLFTPGDYQLEIRSINASGVISSNSIQRKFKVLPEFWQTWWFRSSALLATILLIVFIINRRFKIRQRENYLLTRSLETEQEALSSQITPHFLFNALNSIQNLFQKNQSNEAVLHLANFSWLMRRILQNVKLHSVLLSNELDTLKLYMDLEVLRLNSNFSYNVKLDHDVDPSFIRIPPMIIQPFIENSIWHGILNKPDQNGTIKIDFSIDNDDLRISISDDGVGRKKAKEFKDNAPFPRKSTGLKSVKRRMEVLNEIYKTNLIYHIVDLHDNKGNALGTQIIIKIPLDYA